MRKYLLTPRERKILDAYIDNNIKLDGFSVLAIRLRRSYSKLREDFDRITIALRKLQSE